MSSNSDLLEKLSPIQEHYLKKYVLERLLSLELQQLSSPDCCSLIGEPFKTDKPQDDETLPLMKFFFRKFVIKFPLITSNSKETQLEFWQTVVQPFVESFYLKGISNSEERQSKTSKRKNVNRKLLSGMLLFYNSVLVTPKDLEYIKLSTLKSTDEGKLSKLQKDSNNVPSFQVGMDNYSKMKFINDISINIVAVRKIASPATEAPSYWRSFIVSSKPKRQHHFEFVIQIVKRDEEHNSYDSHFISRAYHDFKQLEHDLKKGFPGLMSAKVPRLPRKPRGDEGINDLHEFTLSSVSLEAVESSDTNETHESKLLNSNKKLFKEKLRLSLRGYLNDLIHHREITNSKIFNSFVSDPELSFTKLTELDLEDHEARLENEEHILRTQFEFQTQTSEIILGLASEFESFKNSLIMKPETLTNLFDELGNSVDLENRSPILRSFSEWCKLEVAATLYQMFLANDNSNQFLEKCLKFHKLFPYRMIYGILRFTNPGKMLSRVLDLLFLNVPSLPKWGSSETKNSRCLLSMIFVMLLDEDLSEFEKEFTVLRENLSQYQMLLEKLDNYTECDYDIHNDIIEESTAQKEDLLITILSTESIPPIASPESIKKVYESFKNFDKLEDTNDMKGCELYLHLKQYWQLKTRQKDKNLMKQLWQEPELVNLIKQFITIFYEPIIAVLAKCDIHLAFKEFQDFMNDLMVELVKLSSGEVYYLSSIEIFNRLRELIDRHESVFWNFIHNIYVKDDQNIFRNIVVWINKLLQVIKLKFVDLDSVLFKLGTSNSVDEALFLKQLSARISLVTGRRRLFKEFLVKAANGKDEIEKDWDKKNEEIFGEIEGEDFGVAGDDIEEFNYLNSEENMDTEEPRVDQMLLREKLHDLEKENSKFGTSELDKFAPDANKQLVELLKKIKV
ncbi:uncharacterized protein PRCAT00002111001 [Priceomyces carsonii]|uniref:uncharacterized protein n=1 Tax=Priceomyces carsonii TaxID=28549 RepID=UPI002ED81E21|nr:unnamed protein product [Priceomyces carsonii]